MAGLGALMLACGVVLLWAVPGYGRLTTRSATTRQPLRLDLVGDARTRTIFCCAGGGIVGMTFVGALGMAVGIGLGGVASVVIGRLEPPGVQRERDEIAVAMPMAVDLLAACAAAGQPPAYALAYVAGCTEGPLGERLGEVCTRLGLGVDPATEWARQLDDEQMGPLARTMLRSLETGAPLVDGLERLAADRRRTLRSLRDAQARSVGVKAAAPLGVCFLPAFMITGVVPTVVSMFTSMSIF